MAILDFQGVGGRLAGVFSRRPAEAAEGDSAGFSAVQAEGMDRLYRTSSFGLCPPFALPGVPFLPGLLGLSGIEIAFVRVLPEEESAFAMRHRRNEVVYIVAEGEGEFLIDGEAISVRAGAILRIGPESIRAWRNTSTADDLLLIAIQARAGRLRWPRRSDVVGLPGRVRWPR